MRILLVNKYYHPRIGGVETLVRTIAEEFAARGHETAVLCMDPEAEEETVINGVRVVRFRRDAPLLAGLNRKAWKWLRDHHSSYDIVHLHNYHILLTFQSAYFLRTRGRPFVMTAHYHGHGHTLARDLLFKAYHVLGRKTLDWSLQVATASEYERSLLQRDFSIPEEKYAIIPNGGREYPRTGVQRVAGRMLYVGRLARYKNVDACIELAAELRRRGRDASLRVVGTGPDRERLEALAAESGVSGHVSFLGDVSDATLAEEYQSASLLLLLSSAEAYGLVVAEALSQGTPCIVAEAAALTEFTREPGCFGVSYPLDAQEVADRTEGLLWRAAPVQVGPFSEKMISWPQVANKYLQLYEKSLLEFTSGGHTGRRAP
jgi:glycosyltransferase involved in cell wall biosynthesis